MLGSGLGGRPALPAYNGDRASPIPLSFPFGTMGVNLLGCLLIGLFYGLATKGMMDPHPQAVSHHWIVRRPHHVLHLYE